MQNKNTIDINITPEDLKAQGLVFSPSGRVIDELAYSINNWTEEDLFSNNVEYEPAEPYNFNFEKDLFSNTKTKAQLITLAEKLDCGSTVSPQKTKLQAGAFMALENPAQWQNLLQTYTSALKECDQTLSKEYEKELQSARDSFWKDMQKEWLYGDRSNAGVIEEIAKYYTEDRNAGHYNQKEDIYTFTIDKDTAKEEYENYTTGNFSIKAYKKYLLDTISTKSHNRKEKDTAERAKRKEERERTNAYKAQRKLEDEKERKAMLLSLTN
jgi:hypothetical protein